MLKNKWNFALLLFIFIGLNSCDVDALLLKGEPVEYDFTNANLPDGVSINEDYVTLFDLVSDYEGEKANIKALYIGNPDRIGTDSVFVYLHGNLSSLNPYWEEVAEIANFGHQHRYGVLAIDYRGFGNSEGASVDIFSMQADVDACLKWLKDQGAKSEQIVMYGYSLGTMPACHILSTTSYFDIENLIIVAPQTTTTALLQDATGFSIHGTSASDFKYDIPAALSKYDKNLLWIHGTADKTASYPNFLKVYNNYESESKSKFILEGAGHHIVQDIPFSDWENQVLKFIE